ncbi:AAA family ATPase [Desulfoscipio gibsoniae]|uniref:AAA family ATPase n=1 Tax=Desulfoscipio gibsoniae TaxID=102134 RepID=UPI0002D2621F|nr:AAA family ATPase [Desulfoscipio gibsoniae]
MLSQLRFKKFKSFTRAAMPVEPITILIGANASGKSNAIDGLQILLGLARKYFKNNSFFGKVN